jgi:cytoplasmic iron level regulating protein YaaA (DUF328/UPF0246 family)
MKAIIIPCSGQKIRGGSSIYIKPRLIDLLGEAEFGRLLALRDKLSVQIGLPPGPDTNIRNMENDIRFLPAYKRYNGKMYQRAEFCEFFPEFRGRVFIISALYGLLDANDHIRFYDLAMDDWISPNERVWQWWAGNGLRRYLDIALKNAAASEVYDLLSNKYRNAIGLLQTSDRYRAYLFSYPGLGIGSLYERGNDLKKILTLES